MLRVFALLLALVVGAPANAGSLTALGAGHAAGGAPAGFQGAGDVQTTNWKLYGGLTAYTAATRGSAVINECLLAAGPSYGTCVDVLTDATTGQLLPPSTIGGNACNYTNSSSDCVVKIIYEVASGTANNWTALSASIAPKLVTQAATGGYCMLTSASPGPIFSGASAITQAQPFTDFTAAVRTGSSGAFSSVRSSGFFNSNEPMVSSGAFLSLASGSLNQWYSIVGSVTTNPSAFIAANSATPVSGNAGTNSAVAGVTADLGFQGASGTYCFEEYGLLSTNLNTTQAAALIVNMHTRLGNYSGF